jgi:hypothetical protein
VRCALDGPRLEENGELGRPGEDVDGALAWPSKEDAGDRGSRTRRRTRSSGGSPRGPRRTLATLGSPSGGETRSCRGQDAGAARVG